MSVYRAGIGVTLVAVMLAASSQYGVAQTGQMSLPENHQVEGFWLKHGQQANADATLCAVCHQREYCSGCHVNAYDIRAIQALPSSEEAAEYAASKEWSAPPTHTPFFLEEHRALAAGMTENCQVCHVVEQQCQICHLGSETLERPRSVTDVDKYHPYNFMQQHSTAAWNQEVECATCHNPQVYCRDCHANLGYATRDGRTDTGFHNESPAFQFGHGQAARQGLEACASCHAQQDCLQCHSAKSGRNINPHGPGFDAEKLRQKNEGLCLFCHWSVPGGGGP